ncbi:hypothetical protein EDB19DRAFT_1008773 [Suillus lakei]|nr:hypothetical protein EDB19DRAFT_1008773 [Suillus lakei]
MHFHSLYIRRLPHRAVFISRQRQLLLLRMLPTRRLRMIGRLSQSLPIKCALPGRHEREFVSSDDSRTYQTAEIKGSYFHPRAYEACAPEPSVSDEPDSLVTPPPDTAISRISVRFTAADSMIPFTRHAQDEIDTTYTFLQHPSQAKEKQKMKRSSRRKRTGHLNSDHAGFAAPSLDYDGCLGGF